MKKTKSLISLLVCLAMVISVAPLGAFARTEVFTDVPSDAWYYDSVYTAYEMGLINGKGNNQYCPESNITIAETLKLAACIYQLKNAGKVTLKSGDGEWYITYLDYCCDVGIIPPYETEFEPGYQDYLYYVDEYITRCDFVYLLSKAMPNDEFDSRNPIDFDSIPDIVESENPYSKAIYKMYRTGILAGSDEEGTFYPESMIQRSEVAAILVRIMDPTKRIGDNKTDNTSAQEKRDAISRPVEPDNGNKPAVSKPIEPDTDKETDAPKPPKADTENNNTGDTENEYTGDTENEYTGDTENEYTGDTENEYTGDTENATDANASDTVDSIGEITVNRDGSVSMTEIPTSVNEIKGLKGFTFSDPKMVAAMAIAAFCTYTIDKDNGIDMLNYLKGPEALSAYDKQFLNDRLSRGNGYVAYSYFETAVPGNGYEVTEPYRIYMKEQSNSRDEAGYIKLFVVSNGADSPRPIQLRHKASTNEWFLNNYSSLLSGVREPAEADPWK